MVFQQLSVTSAGHKAKVLDDYKLKPTPITIPQEDDESNMEFDTSSMQRVY